VNKGWKIYFLFFSKELVKNEMSYYLCARFKSEAFYINNQPSKGYFEKSMLRASETKYF
jgi:hypothetical protein